MSPFGGDGVNNAMLNAAKLAHLLIERRQCNNAVAQPLLISRLCARKSAAMNKNR
ncbi:hypothetical protein [Pseudomonas sp. Root562]|uniref:hypothetical protein n=1 Tax=Pseudomonas sp. Root562 TaxID=1736561 RepID=UPI001F2B77BF|nr:hypothetical protein [Pseudomonas sp. Root562]